jgi:hypothetical protein
MQLVGRLKTLNIGNVTTTTTTNLDQGPDTSHDKSKEVCLPRLLRRPSLCAITSKCAWRLRLAPNLVTGIVFL